MRIEKNIEGGGLFLNDRFAYKVNNAYLLKKLALLQKLFFIEKNILQVRVNNQLVADHEEWAARG